MHDSSRKHTFLGVATGIFAVVAQAVISFFLTPFIVRVLGEEANGFVQLANNFVMYASLLTIAFNSMGSRFMSVSYHNNDLQKAKRYYSSLILCNVFITLLLLPLAIVITLYLDRLLVIETADVTQVKVLFLCVFLNFIVNQYVALFSMSMYVRNRMYIQNVLNFIRNTLNAVLLLCVFSLLPVRLYYVSAVALLLTVILLPVYYGLHRKMLPGIRFRPSAFSFSSIAEMFKSGVWNTVNQGGHILMTGLDLLLANLFVDPVSMGVLSVSKVIPTFITHVAASINTNLSPSVTIAWAQNGNVDALKELRRGMKVSGILVATPIIVFCGFGVEFYRLWTPSLDSWQLAILSFLACLALIPMAGPQALFNLFTAANKLRVNAISFLATGVANVLLVYILLSSGFKYGIFAIAGVSAVLSIIRNLVITLPYAASILKLKWYEFYKDVGLSLLCCCIVAAVVAAVKLLVPADSWWGIVAAAAVTGVLAVYVESLLLLKKDERARLLELVKSKLHRR